jgi:hypothetical protein
MPLCEISRREIATTVVVEIFILLAPAFAVVRYVEWLSDADVAEFMSAAKPSASDPAFTPSRTLAPTGGLAPWVITPPLGGDGAILSSHLPPAVRSKFD